MNLVASVKKCCRCKEEKPLESFALARKKKDGRQSWCRSCTSEHQARNREQQRIRQARWRKNNPGAQNRYLREAREQAIAHYSLTSPPSCVCCLESEPAFLVLDHINGGGNEERRRVGRRSFFNYLRARAWPDGYQVLCWNCNSAKQYQGACPHQSSESA